MPKPAALGLILVATSCFSEPLDDSGSATLGNESGSETAADSTADPSTVGDPSSATMGSESMSSSTAGTSVSDATTVGPMDTGDDDPSGPLPCGAFGEPCCDGGCDEGACLDDECVAFAGAYIEGELCSDCPNVLAADQCGCPAGFNASEAIAILSSGCIKEGPKSDLPWIDETIAFCEAPVYLPGRSDWGGAYMTADVEGGGCLGEADCLIGNEYAEGACGCPDQSTAVEVRLFAHCGGDIPDPPAAYRLGMCLGNNGPGTIGGIVYREGGACLESSPEAECECPAGFAEQSLRVISRASPNQAGDLGFCVRE